MQTETGNVYVLVPVPASVKTAIKVTAELPHEVIAKQEAAIDKSIPTPRLGAHPDLTGNHSRTDWIGNYMTGGGRRCAPTEAPDATARTIRPTISREPLRRRISDQVSGRWEGDTLVIDSVSFVDSTWLGRGGFFHFANMHVVEKFTRQGGDAGLLAARGDCEVYATNDIASQIRH